MSQSTSGAVKKAGIAIDAWKRPIFERRLREAGFSFTVVGELTKDTLALTVETNDMARLKIVVRAANTEAAVTKKGHC